MVLLSPMNKMYDSRSVGVWVRRTPMGVSASCDMAFCLLMTKFQASIVHRTKLHGGMACSWCGPTVIMAMMGSSAARKYILRDCILRLRFLAHTDMMRSSTSIMSMYMAKGLLAT